MKFGRKWQAITCKDYVAAVEILAFGLYMLGIQKGEKVATLFSKNCPEWNFIDMALSKIGAVHVPVYPTISDSDYLYILNQTQVRYVFVSDQIIYNRVSVLQKEIPTLEGIYTSKPLPNISSIDELMQMGLGGGREVRLGLKERQEDISPDDVVTIIYTSGSTGLPKGVMLSHTNLISSMMAASDIQPLGHFHRIMSFLPLCHVYERTANYMFQYRGSNIYYCENLKALTGNLKEVKPHGITVVPRLLEKVIRYIVVNSRKGSFIIRLVIRWAIRFGFRFRPYRKKEPVLFKIRYRLADLILFRFVRSSFGGKVKYIGCGGAHLNEKVTRFFWAARMPVYEGYGLTECSPLVALNSPGKGNYWIGTVGPHVRDVEIKLAEDGEILCKGPSVMKGYFCQEELTKKTLKDGWLHTGDIGTMVKDRYLKITGRKKQMFKTSYGRYIVPQAIESKFIGSAIIDYIMVVGEGKHCAAAIICPVFSHLRRDFDPHNKLSDVRLIELPEVKKAIKKEIDRVNRGLGKTERLQKHLIVPDHWSVESGELSPTLKIKRNIILHKYNKQILGLYRKESI